MVINCMADIKLRIFYGLCFMNIKELIINSDFVQIFLVSDVSVPLASLS